MGTYVPFAKVEITRLETPLQAVFKTHTETYTLRVRIEFHGRSIQANMVDLAAAEKFIRDNETYYRPSWEEVTDDGRYGCD